METIKYGLISIGIGLSVCLFLFVYFSAIGDHISIRRLKQYPIRIFVFVALPTGFFFHWVFSELIYKSLEEETGKNVELCPLRNLEIPHQQ